VRARSGNPFHAYQLAMEASPLLTKCVSSGVMFAISDAIAQFGARYRKGERARRFLSLSLSLARAHERTDLTLDRSLVFSLVFRGRTNAGRDANAPSFDLARVGRYAFFGAVANAPMFVVYYGCLDFVVDTGLSALPTSYLMGVLTKVTIDQLLWTPFLYLPVFFGAMALLEGRGLVEARAEVKKKGWGLTPTLVANWKFWVPVLCITFSAVPREMRILFNNVCALAWTAYLSTIQSEMAPTESVVPKSSSSP